MDDRRVLTIGAAGTGAKAWVLPGGYQIAGIKIDNKSGSWLLLPDGTFIPPYTIGFGHSFQPMLASIDVMFATGPANQVSTLAGDNPVVHIYSDPVGESPGLPSGQGTAFIEQFTPISSARTLFETSSQVNTVTTLVVGVFSNKRARVLTYSIAKMGQGLFSDSGMWYIFRSSDGAVQTGGFLGPNTYESGVQPWGVDFPVGTNIVCEHQADWARFQVQTTVTWQVI